MQVVCKRHTELPHTSKLFSDLLYRFDRVAGFYPHAPFDPAAYQASANSISFPDERRAQLVKVLRSQNGDSPSLDLLAKPGTVAVLTGQQVGLFSGPAYTIYKALSAVRMARVLTQQGIPAVPVFWLATEDHDLAEISTCWTFNASQEPVQLRIDHPAGSDRPVGGIPMDSLPLEALHQSLSGFPFGEEIEALVRKSYVPGRTFGEAFRGLLQDLLAAYDLLYFDPMRLESRQLAAPFVRQVIQAAPDLVAKLLERNRKLNEAGYHAQVHIEKETSLFFLIDQGHRLTLRRKDGAYHSRDQRFTDAELMDRAECISPNATLRPVVQDYMFPTVAYIGGPAELAYLAQSEVLYSALLGRMPVATPRNCFTLIDGHTTKLMTRFGLQLESFFGGQDQLEEKIAARLTPPNISSAIESVSMATSNHLDDLERTISGFDATLGAAMNKSAAKILYQLQKMNRKVARESLRRNDRARDDARFLFNAIYPHKHLQERFYTMLPFLAQHGVDMVDRIFEQVHVDCPDHHLLYL